MSTCPSSVVHGSAGGAEVEGAGARVLRSAPVTPIDELRALLRPAGGGLYLVSTGKREQLALQQRLYGAGDEAAVARAFDAALDRLAGARAFVLGVPSDVGAGFRRGRAVR